MSSFTQPPAQRAAPAPASRPSATQGTGGTATPAQGTGATAGTVAQGTVGTAAQGTGGTVTTAAPRTARLPDAITMQNAVKVAISEDKPIMMDYWVNSLEKTVMIGVKETPGQEQERLLVKNEEEYTSPIAKIFKSAGDFIIMTENSIYIVDNQIQIRKIT